MNYFRFEIPTNADGTRVSYSKGWHGTMPHCPSGVTVLLYNDKEGYGIARTEDAITQPELKALAKTTADKVLATQKKEDGVYFGEAIDNRIEWLPEVTQAVLHG